jgi:hypothetical protein
MPDDIKPPKTIAEMGIHFVYMRKAQNDTSEAIKEVAKTLKEIQTDSVGRVEFNDHVIWGENVVKDHESRISALEDDNKGTMHQVAKALDKKIVVIIVTLLLGAVGWTAYMTTHYRTVINSLPEVVTKK